MLKVKGPPSGSEADRPPRLVPTEALSSIEVVVMVTPVGFSLTLSTRIVKVLENCKPPLSVVRTVTLYDDLVS